MVREFEDTSTPLVLFFVMWVITPGDDPGDLYYIGIAMVVSTILLILFFLFILIDRFSKYK
jgi:hypothetical protein